MAQSISALNATLPLSSDHPSTFISKPLRSNNMLQSRRNSFGSIVSMAGRGSDLDHLQRSIKRRPDASASAPVDMNSILFDRYPTPRSVQHPADDQLLSYSRGRTPWEIKEKESEYKLRFDMPGMTREDVKVFVEENMLVLQAEKAPRNNKNKKKKMEINGGRDDVSTNNGDVSENNTAVNGNNVGVEEEEEEEGDWPAKSFGRYRSMIALPENIQLEKIKAEVKDGVLYITIPKAIVSAKVLNIAVQ
ncbi:hypothetical protein QQ045_020391 [Rhodiola kirilowii]